MIKNTRIASTIVSPRFFYAIKGIEGILGEQGTDGPSLSVIVNRASKDLRREIYDCEMQLVQRLDTGFDFRLIDRRDQPLCEVLNVELYDIYLRM